MIKYIKPFWLLIVLGCILSQAFAQTAHLKIATYNIRNDNQGDVERGNGWQQRLPVIAQLIRYNEFDIFGAQEVLHNQLTDLLNRVPEYHYVGVGRDDGETKGEYAPIFYRKDRYTLVAQGNFWFGEITNKPTKGWDAALPRICTYAKFKSNLNGKTFWVFNLHLDHVGVLARQNSCLLVLEKIKALAGRETALLMGDFNVDQHNPIYGIINDSGLLRDAYSLSTLTYALNGTFNAFDSDLMTDSRIDHIFVTSNVRVHKYAVLTDSYRSPKEEAKEIKKGDFPTELSFKNYSARMPSDHFPVCITVSF